MKSERRHELQQNKLADYLTTTINAVKPYLRIIIGVVLAGVVITVVLIWKSNRSREADVAAWDAFFLNDIPVKVMAQGNVGLSPQDERLRKTAKDQEDTPLGHFALLTTADFQLARGLNELLRNWDAGRKDLKRAAQNYNDLLGQEPALMIQQKATFGLARAHEGLGKLNDAVKGYQKIVDAWPDCAYVKVAEARIADLQLESTRDFYANLQSLVQSRDISIDTNDAIKRALEEARKSAGNSGGDLKIPGLIGDPKTDAGDGKTAPEKGEKTDPATTDPTKPDPTKPDPTKPDPTKPDPTKPDPTKPDPTKPDPTKPDPTKPDPTKPDPTKPDPTKPDPTKPDPTKPDPTKPDPTKPDPTKPDPTKPDAVKPDPAKPAKADPSKQDAAKTPPPKADDKAGETPATKDDGDSKSD